MFGYSYFLPKKISCFSIYDIDFNCLKVLTHSKYIYLEVNMMQLFQQILRKFIGILREKYGAMSIRRDSNLNVCGDE